MTWTDMPASPAAWLASPVLQRGAAWRPYTFHSEGQDQEQDRCLLGWQTLHRELLCILATQQPAVGKAVAVSAPVGLPLRMLSGDGGWG